MEDTKASFRQAPSSLSSSPSAFCKRCATEKRRMQYYSLSFSPSPLNNGVGILRTSDAFISLHHTADLTWRNEIRLERY